MTKFVALFAFLYCTLPTESALGQSDRARKEIAKSSETFEIACKPIGDHLLECTEVVTSGRNKGAKQTYQVQTYALVSE